MAADLLMGPAIIGGLLLGGFALGVDTVNHLEPVTVTGKMEELGLSSEVVSEGLVTRIAQITDIDTEFHRVGAKDIAGTGVLEALAEALHLDQVMIAARKLPGAIRSEFQPSFIEREGKTFLVLRVVRPQTGVRLIEEFAVEKDRYDIVLRQATRAIMAVVDPVALVMDDMRRGDHVSARQSLEQADRAAADEMRYITDTLRGLLLLEENKAAQAVAEFQTALLRKAGFAPAKLGLAIAVARVGDAAGSRAILDEIETGSSGLSPRARREVPATAAFIRARVAGGNGQWAEAMVELRKAVDAVPNFAEAHAALAETYDALGMPPLADYHAHAAARLSAPDVPRFDDRLDSFLKLTIAATMLPGEPSAPPVGGGLVPVAAPHS
jgi:tetratricopeptide (TPR) repeat protein